MKRSFLVLLILVLYGSWSLNTFYKTTDIYARNRVLKLFDVTGACSAVLVWAPSGKAYTLTAGHCRPEVHEGKIKARNESGQEYLLDFIAEDPTADLMLLSAPYQIGMDIAKNIGTHEPVHTMTHGRGMPSYRTDGEFLVLDLIEFALFPVVTVEDLVRCSGPKYVVMQKEFETMCGVQSFQSVTTARIVPGSSGGPLMNAWGELVGIASTTDDSFSTFASLADIHAFLKGR
jgi:hypothetical protein